MVNCIYSLLFITIMSLILYDVQPTLGQTSVELVIFRDDDSLTVFVPNNGQVSLEGFKFQATRATEELVERFLVDYSSFRGFPFQSVPTPICFRLLRDGSNRVAPGDCPAANTHIQRLSNADIFWHDSALGQNFLVLIFSGDTSQGLCPAGLDRCPVTYSPSTIAPTPPNPTPTTAIATRIPLGHAGNPVTSNSQWTAQIETFGDVEMVLVPAGCFVMGSTDTQVDYALVLGAEHASWLDIERPAEQLCFNQPFWIDRFEVSNVQFSGAGDNFPRTDINWFEARDFCERRGGRLPTEAEWEYAARGPDNLFFPWGNRFDGRLLNFCDANCALPFANPLYDDRYPNGAPVSEYSLGQSWVGTYNLSGNVWEWVSTIYGDDGAFPYPYSAGDGRENLLRSDVQRVHRGGSWDNQALHVRSAQRAGAIPTLRSPTVGFRCARSF